MVQMPVRVRPMRGYADAAARPISYHRQASRVGKEREAGLPVMDSMGNTASSPPAVASSWPSQLPTFSLASLSDSNSSNRKYTSGMKHTQPVANQQPQGKQWGSERGSAIYIPFPIPTYLAVLLLTTTCRIPPRLPPPCPLLSLPCPPRLYMSLSWPPPLPLLSVMAGPGLVPKA